MAQTAYPPGTVLPVDHGAIDAVLAGRLVRPLFQPIVDLSTHAVMGLEALARGPAGSSLEFPDQLFPAAQAAGRYAELNALCAERALECALESPTRPPLLFINAEPALLNHPVSPRLTNLEQVGLPFPVVIEFTERALPALPGSLMRVSGRVQGWGNSIALDDVGVDPMSLFFLPVLEPEVIKLDMGLIRNPHAETTLAVSAVVRAEARRTGAVVIAEGIETEEDLAAARELGAHWGQGWLFGRPGRIEQAADRFDASGASVLPASRPGFHQPPGTPFQAASGLGKLTTGTADAIAAALARLRDALSTDGATDAVVVAACPDAIIPGVAVSLQELVGKARSVILLDEPVPGEFAAVVIGGGHGRGLCVRSSDTLEMVEFDHLPTVAAVSRILLFRLP
jgi:EAL domain-containing protein (putative c-di-GMP-specific phosphodiesterase class I)